MLFFPYFVCSVKFYHVRIILILFYLQFFYHFCFHFTFACLLLFIFYLFIFLSCYPFTLYHEVITQLSFYRIAITLFILLSQYRIAILLPSIVLSHSDNGVILLPSYRFFLRFIAKRYEGKSIVLSIYRFIAQR